MTSLYLFILVTAVFYVLYKIAFSQMSFYSLNRWVLLSIPVWAGLAALAPNIIPQKSFTLPNLAPTVLAPIFLDATPTERVSLWSWPMFYLTLYVTGAVISLLLLSLKLNNIYHLIRQASPKSDFNIAYLQSNKATAPFSFLRYIVLPPKTLLPKQKRAILEHEQVHCVQGHSFDNLYYNLLISIAWFNPFLYLIAKELRQVHECIADAETLKHTPREDYAQMLLSQTLGKEVAIPAHPFFNSSLIKTRITMMYKKKTNTKMKLTYLLLAPVLAASILYSCSKGAEETTSTEEAKKVMAFSVADMPPLGEDCDPKASKDVAKRCFQETIISRFSKNFSYPESAKKAGLEGKLYVRFVIDKSGNISFPEIAKGLAKGDERTKLAAEETEQEAIRAVKALGTFTPAQFNGTPVAVEFVLPVAIKLPATNSNPQES